MKVISGLLIAAVGSALMAWAYFGYMRLDTSAPWSSGMIYVGDGAPNDVPELAELRRLSVTLRELPLDPLGAALLQSMARTSEDRRRSLAAQLTEKLLLLAPSDAGIGESSLFSGRMPRAGNDEVLAGFQATAKDRLAVAGREFKVVGVLRRDVALLADCYLVPPSPSVAALFGGDDGAVHPAVLVELPVSKLPDGEVRERLKEVFPHEQFAAVGAMARADRRPYYLYLAGEGLFLLGGSLALIALYRMLAGRGVGVFRGPLAELVARPKLLGALHFVYFGLVIAASAIVYNFPQVQRVLLSGIGEAFTDPHGPLGAVSKAYLSHSIPRAAAMTFLVNFFAGSIAVITIPSLIVPGSGTLMAIVRATAWGLLLAPAFVLLSFGMLAHAGTLLLEGEGYILAAFFGLMVPIYMLRREEGVGLGRRYGRALMINLKAMALVAAVLAIAACYEALEVILMHP